MGKISHPKGTARRISPRPQSLLPSSGVRRVAAFSAIVVSLGAIPYVTIGAFPAAVAANAGGPIEGRAIVSDSSPGTFGHLSEWQGPNRLNDRSSRYSVAPLMSLPAVAQSWSCQPRRTCSQIGSCEEANWYLSNCSWGGKLDRDGDGVACETLC